MLVMESCLLAPISSYPSLVSFFLFGGFLLLPYDKSISDKGVIPCAQVAPTADGGEARRTKRE